MTESRRLWWPGVPLALASAALFGASTPLAKRLLGEMDPWLLAGLLYLGAGVGLWLARRGARAFALPANEAPLDRADWPWLLGAIAFGGVAGPVLLMSGLARMDAAGASLLLILEGLATMAIAWLAFRENVDRRLLVGAAAILAGAALLAWEGGVSLGFGAALVALACLAWGIDNNLTRKLSASDPAQIAMIKGFAAGGVNLALALGWRDVAPPPPELWVYAGAVGYFGYGVSVALFVAALRHLGVARASAYFSLAPFAGAALAVLWLGEAITLRLLAAGALMALGLYLHLAERHEHEHVHEAMEHEHRHVHDEHHRHAHAPGDSAGAPHSHRHRHERLVHRHPHYPDLHHRHGHRGRHGEGGRGEG
jgi:drug/metabolite transporter (DMT)-like permease